METTLIKALQQEIESKKLVLKMMKLEEKQKNKKLFSETKFGKMYLKSLSTLTLPFHKMYKHASAHLQNPVTAHFSKLADDTEELLKEAIKTQSSDAKARSIANECARLFMEMDTFNSKHELPALCEANKYMLQLKEQLERLRSPSDPNQFSVLNKQLEASFPQV